MLHGTRNRNRLSSKLVATSGDNDLPAPTANKPAKSTSTMTSYHATATWTWASLYLLSGISQPLIMTQAKRAGLANSSAQLYMFFYYLGPSFLLISLLCNKTSPWPPMSLIYKAILIALIDIVAQGLNYAGAGLAGPTVFSIIYSSVTIWAAIFSRVLLHRSLTTLQWLAVCCVVCGLAITAADSATLGPEVGYGSAMVVVGSMMHGATYVMSEAIMTRTSETLSARQNAAIQGTVACLVLGFWQLVYTLPRWERLIREPMQQAATSILLAAVIMTGFGLANLLHSVAFSHTLKDFPGGATSAGVMKGLQAVLVFVASDWIYCGHLGGPEMCFTRLKFTSLVIVSSGVIAFALLNNPQRMAGYNTISSDARLGADLVV